MNGFSQVRIGGTGARSAAPVAGDMLHNRAYGWQSAGQSFAPTFMRHMYDYGTTPEQVAHVKMFHSHHASNNPKAYYKKRFTVEDVINSRFICKPLHLLDCCVETDNATCDHRHLGRARPRLKQPLVLIRGVVGRCNKPRLDMHYQHGPISTVAGYYAREILWPNAGVGPEDVDITGSYDAFTFTTMLQLEDYGFCKKGEGGALRVGRDDPARRPAAQQHLRRPSLRGLHPRHEHGHREHPATAPRRRRFLPGRRRRQAPAHLRLQRRRLPPGQGMSRSAPISAGPTRRPRRRWSCGAAEHRDRGDRTMPNRGEYLGMGLQLDDLDLENLEYFQHCAAHDFHLQACAQCGRLRYPPTTACPWCMALESTWKKVEGKGAVHSYSEVHHAIQPAFRGHTPYLILLVDLDTQKGEPTADEALRVVGNLCTPDGQLAPPELVRRVGIGTRVRMVFSDVADGLALPQWTIDETATAAGERLALPAGIRL